jgi:hypothetical protein
VLRRIAYYLDPRDVFEPITAADLIVLGWTILFVGFFLYAMSRPLP